LASAKAGHASGALRDDDEFSANPRPKAAIQAVVQQQLDAFRADDGTAAFARAPSENA
jgi:hypothetical protein